MRLALRLETRPEVAAFATLPALIPEVVELDRLAPRAEVAWQQQRQQTGDEHEGRCLLYTSRCV